MGRKLSLLIKLGILSSAFAVGFVIPTATFAKSWTIQDWNAVYDVASTGVVHVTQTMQLEFDGTFSFVDVYIPKTFIADYGRVEISNLHAFDGDGNALSDSAFVVDQHTDRVNMTLHFDAQDELKTFRMTYDVARAIRTVESLSVDQFIWNVVPDDREVGISTVEAKVILPQNVEPADTQASVFVGSTGSTDAAGSTASFSADTFSYTAENILPWQHMTIVAQWPKGLVSKMPADPTVVFLHAITYPAYALPCIVGVFLFVWFLRYGRDPHGRGTIIPLYEPPDALAPAHVGALMDEHVKPSSIVALMIDLAQRGYIRIIEEKRTSLFSQHEYTFVKTNNADSKTLSPVESKMMQVLFGTEEGTKQESIKMSQLKHTLPMQVPQMRKMILQELFEKKYFRESPHKTRLKYFAVSTGLAVLGLISLLVLGILYEHFDIGISLVMIAVEFAIVAFIMPQHTRKGVEAVELAKGFKLYLHHAERFRMRKLTPELFNAYLPYAIVFGIERDWAHVFEGIVVESPSWYSTTQPGGALSVLVFTQNLHSGFMHAATQNMHTSSSGGGGSFAGGGFGGGGIHAG